MLSEFLSETTALERNQQVERIIKYRLNPFEVLKCSPEMTPDEINTGYRKISLSVHPGDVVMNYLMSAWMDILLHVGMRSPVW